jgi:hypothetical protein
MTDEPPKSPWRRGLSSRSARRPAGAECSHSISGGNLGSPPNSVRELFLPTRRRSQIAGSRCLFNSFRSISRLGSLLHPIDDQHRKYNECWKDASFLIAFVATGVWCVRLHNGQGSTRARNGSCSHAFMLDLLEDEFGIINSNLITSLILKL